MPFAAQGYIMDFPIINDISEEGCRGVTGTSCIILR